MHIFNLYIIILISVSCSLDINDNKIIISLTSDINNIQNTKLVINSIIEQNIHIKYFEILLILSSKEFKNIRDLPKEIQLLYKTKRIRILFIKKQMTGLTSTLISMEKYKNNPILIINNKCLLPNGWLKMFIEDHKKYPNDAISASVQYYFGKNGKIKEFSEGFKGHKFGTFNHVTNIIFNFALVNNYLGGILYPRNFFQDKKFYDENLFLKAANNSEDFWHSAFIIMEDKTLRQSSKIFDYTKYLLNDINYEDAYKDKKKLFKAIKNSFSKIFLDFEDNIRKRQNKIIVSLTSYPKRFSFLPGLMSFIRNQTYKINTIRLILYRNDFKNYKLNISDIEVVSVNKNLKSHLKYFYSMKSFRNYAIITIDDDIGYAQDTFQSLFNAYIENPNIISGRRSHLIKYKKNGELKRYIKWSLEQNIIKEPSFDITLTNVAGTIFPPDILNIKDNYLPIIRETITCDDMTLKYFSTIKGIPPKWIVNNNLLGISRDLPKTNAKPLYKINNRIMNDICLNKLNILSNNIILNNLCVEYKNIQTGTAIYLFNIHNENKINNRLFFDIYAFSYCPIDSKLKFNITFDKSLSVCFFNETKQFLYGYNLKNNAMIASCYMNESDHDLNYFYFPKATSGNNLFIKIYNYRKHLTTIFRSFTCKTSYNCILKIISLENFSEEDFEMNLNNRYYICSLDEYYLFTKNIYPRIIRFKCFFSEIPHKGIKIIISGIPTTMDKITKNINDDKIPNQFQITRVVNGKYDGIQEIIIIGNLVNDLKTNLTNLSINFIYPNLTLNCSLNSSRKYIQSKIHCINYRHWNKEILLENQIVYSSIDNEELLLINKETLIKLEFNKVINEDYLLFNNKRRSLHYLIIIFNIFILAKILLKSFFSKNNCIKYFYIIKEMKYYFETKI